MITISTNKLTKKFGAKTAVDNLTLNVKSGEIYGFLGPNGAGKTTTIRMLMGFIKPTSGTAKLYGELAGRQVGEVMNQVGFLSADSTLYPNWTAAQHIRFVARIRGGDGIADSLVKQFDLDTHTRAVRLSSGNKQKLALVLALMNQPKLLVLDEPIRGLDPILQQEIHEILREFRQSGGSVFMSSHNLAEVEQVCDQVAIIREGKLVTSESMSSLRSLQVHQIMVVFASKYNKAKFEQLKNVEIQKATDRELILHVKGDLTPVMHLIGSQTVRDVEIGHISLEDMFMRLTNA